MGGNQFIEGAKEVGVVGDRQNGARGFIGSGHDTRNTFSERKYSNWKRKIKMLEGELREAALYSAVAEHGSSMNKVHT